MFVERTQGRVVGSLVGGPRHVDSAHRRGAPRLLPCPRPKALTDVLNRLADPNVPGINKVNLVEGATPDNAGTLDKFINALRDNGYLPMTFAANNVAWSDKNPSHVMATITVNAAQANNKNFTFPMEFVPCSSPRGVAVVPANCGNAVGPGQLAGSDNSGSRPGPFTPTRTRAGPGPYPGPAYHPLWPLWLITRCGSAGSSSTCCWATCDHSNRSDR